MHYGINDFSKNGLATISVYNNQLYEREGKPTLGQLKGLSDIDVRQITNTMVAMLLTLDLELCMLEYLKLVPLKNQDTTMPVCV